ncbi:MAG: prepilin-type N-terminal cleavage/methylation domain-containing protein [Candidatus Harrisonbacteria bacterium]|nr:prepilin-type N-terminal cleavage/methylation domain-containing protein [Candidatus Harrisonbacteria bacterium]
MIDKNFGFTLVEILVTLAITSLLVGVLITYNRTGGLQILIFKDQARVINMVLRAKSLAVQIFSQSIPVCGYGVHFDSVNKSFILFKDLADPCSGSDNRYSGSTEDLEIINLDSQLKFSNLELTDILFIPPEPIVIIDGDSGKSGDFLIELDTIRGGSPKIIKVNNFGQVSTQ